MSVIQFSRRTKLNAEKTSLCESVSWRRRTRKIIHFITEEMAGKILLEGKFVLVTMYAERARKKENTRERNGTAYRKEKKRNGWTSV